MYIEQDVSVLGFRNLLRKQKIALMFHGIMSQDVLAVIANDLRVKSENEVIAKRLFGIVIELAQNIHHYSKQIAYSEIDNKEVGIGTIVVRETNTHFYIISGNVVDKNQEKFLLEKCHHINSLDSEQLRDYYLEQRRLPQRSEVSANIGLIDMARKSETPLEVEMISIDDSQTFFAISVCVKKQY